MHVTCVVQQPTTFVSPDAGGRHCARAPQSRNGPPSAASWAKVSISQSALTHGPTHQPVLFCKTDRHSHLPGLPRGVDGPPDHNPNRLAPNLAAPRLPRLCLYLATVRKPVRPGRGPALVRGRDARRGDRGRGSRDLETLPHASCHGGLARAGCARTQARQCGQTPLPRGDRDAPAPHYEPAGREGRPVVFVRARLRARKSARALGGGGGTADDGGRPHLMLRIQEERGWR